MKALLAILPAFIQSLPYLIQLLGQCMGAITRFVLWAHKNELHLYFEKVESKIDLLEKAQTPDEKHDAARGLSDLLRGLG